MQSLSQGNCHEPLKHRAQLLAAIGSSSGHLVHSSRTRPDGIESTPEVRIRRRAIDALGHSRGRWYRGNARTALDSTAASLWGSSSLLILEQPSRGIPQPAHAARSPPGRSARGRRPAGGEFHQLATCGGERVVSGPYHRTLQHCRGVDQDGEASAEDCLHTLLGRSIRELHCPWHVALGVGSGLGAAQLRRTTSRGLARSRTAASASIARRCELRLLVRT